jgi:hypothetical protein
MFVCKCVLYYCHRVATQLQLTNISIYRIDLLQLDFHFVGSVGRILQKQESDRYMQKEKQYMKQYKNTEYTK